MNEEDYVMIKTEKPKRRYVLGTGYPVGMKLSDSSAVYMVGLRIDYPQGPDARASTYLDFPAILHAGKTKYRLVLEKV